MFSPGISREGDRGILNPGKTLASLEQLTFPVRHDLAGNSSRHLTFSQTFAKEMAYPGICLRFWFYIHFSGSVSLAVPSISTVLRINDYDRLSGGRLWAYDGADDGIRTHDLLITNQPLHH